MYKVNKSKMPAEILRYDIHSLSDKKNPVPDSRKYLTQGKGHGLIL